MCKPVMSDDNLIPVKNIESGAKYTNAAGLSAIKNGQKKRGVQADLLRKPEWLRIKAKADSGYHEVRKTVHKHKLATVCEEAMCPNISECWSKGTATIMLMGDICTRTCGFCAVDTGNPQGKLEANEPLATAESVLKMGLKYVVLTSVNRDDVADGGAGHYAQVVREVKRLNPETAVEVLTPDFQGVLEHVALVVDSGIEVFAQNLETVRRLTHPVRDPRAGYQQTLDVLAFSKRHKPSVLTKTSLMLGLGETVEELEQAMDDLRAIDCNILTLGQYMQPTRNHLPVQRYVHPDEFEQFRQMGLAKGFTEVVSGALVRSSYRAEQVLQGNNVGL